MVKKLTLAQVARMARARDKEAWDSLSREQQLEWVAKLNAERQPAPPPPPDIWQTILKNAELMPEGKPKGEKDQP